MRTISYLVEERRRFGSVVECRRKIFFSAKQSPSLATARQAPKAAKIGPRRLIASRERSGKAPSSLRFAGAVQKGFVECGGKRSATPLFFAEASCL